VHKEKTYMALSCPVTLLITDSLIECVSSMFYGCYKVPMWFQVDLNRPMKEVLSELTKFPIKTRLSLTGTLVVARDIAHAKLKERMDSGQGMPDYMKNHPVYYAGPAKTPDV